MRRSPPLSVTASRIRPAVFADLQSRIDRLAARGEELVPFHIGDTHLAPPEDACRVLRELDTADASLFRYGPTAGLAPLREAIARHRRLEVDPATEILIGNGGTHALYCAARAILDQGDEIILASPYWPLAPGVFTACGAVPVEAPLTQRLYDDPSLDAAELLAAAHSPRTKAIYFISPNNPDGKVLRPSDLERIAAFAIERDLWVFADEVYADTTFTGEHVSIATLPGMRERTVVLHSLSKSHALAGLRIGFVVAPEAVISSARRVSTHTAFNVSITMQRAALAALEDASFPQKARDAYREARDAAAAVLASANVKFHLAEGATYLFVDFAAALAEGPPADRPLLALLERAVDRGVLLAPGDAFGTYPTSARLCFTSVPVPRVVDGASRLASAIEAYRRGDP